MNEQLDPLSGVLRSVRLRGSVFFHMTCRDEWASLAPGSRVIGPAVMPDAEHVIEYHMFARGGGWIAIDGEPPLKLSEGDIVMLPQGDAHVVSSAPGVHPVRKDNAAILGRVSNGERAIPIAFAGGACRVGEGLRKEDATTIVVCGFIACDLKPFNPLIDSLPRMLHFPSGEVGAWVAPMVEAAAVEYLAPRAGSLALLQQVGEAVFVDGARRYLESLPPDARGWLGALRDRHVGRAIALIHEMPSEPWTLEGLGQRVGLSRSALHERFVSLMGVTPAQYLTNWRMQCGAKLLRETHATVASIALEVGYESEAAFARAFKRATGRPPAGWRKAQT